MCMDRLNEAKMEAFTFMFIILMFCWVFVVYYGTLDPFVLLCLFICVIIFFSLSLGHVSYIYFTYRSVYMSVSPTKMASLQQEWLYLYLQTQLSVRQEVS